MADPGTINISASGVGALPEDWRNLDFGSLMMMLAIEQSQTTRQAIESQVADMYARNDQIKGLNAALNAVRAAAKTDDGQALTGDDAKAVLDALEKSGVAVPTGMTVKPDEAELAELNGVKQIFAGVPDTNGALITDDPAEIAKFRDYIQADTDRWYGDAGLHGGMNLYDKDGNSLTNPADWDKVVSIKVEHWRGNNLGSVNRVLDQRIATASTPSLSGSDDDFQNLIDNIKTSVESLSSNNQLDMLKLQSLNNDYSQIIDRASNIESSDKQTKGNITSNLR